MAAAVLINLPVLKEHNASGVTGCLKNLAYGSFNNVARTHVDPKTYTDPVIPVMCSVGPLRSKSVLHIMDGIRAVYHGGPFGWNPEFVWEAKTLLIGTDPVAIDRVELEIVEQKRREVGAPSLVDRNPGRDPVRPPPQVPAVLEALVSAQGAQEGLLEGVVRAVAAGELSEIRVNLVAVFLVEPFEGRYRHGVHHLL